MHDHTVLVLQGGGALGAYQAGVYKVRQLWEAGLEDVRRMCAHRDWLTAREVVAGVRVFDLSLTPR